MSEGGEGGAAGGGALSNRDFARLFREQMTPLAETVDTPAPSSAPAAAPVLLTVTETKPEPPRMSRAQLASLGQWEKHTKGFGMKMLAKMGFKGRLGKDERGVSATVEVVQRPALMGIGFGNFTEASALQHNRKLQRELRGETPETPESAATNAQAEDDGLWRKRKAPAAGTTNPRKRPYKRAADVSREAAAAANASQRNDTVLDMRGPDVRVLAHVSDAYDVNQQATAPPKLGDELLYNVRLVVNQAQNQIADLSAKTSQSAQNVASLEKEATILSAQVAMENVRRQHVEAMNQRLEAVERAAAVALESHDVTELVALLSGVRETFPQEFAAYKVHQVVPSLCIPPLKARLSAAALSSHENCVAVAHQLRVVRRFLLDVPSGAGVGGSVFHNIHEKVNSVGEDLYNYVLEETVWPAVAQFVTYQWRVTQAPGDCLSLFEQLRPHLSLDFEAAFLLQLVRARLKKECERYDPQAPDTVPLHDWLLPWLPVLGDAMHALFPAIRLALSSVLNRWHPSDLSVRALLRPWRDVWGEHEYAKFTHRHVVRQLVRCLQRDVEINPQKQSLEALTWVLAWKEHLPERQFVALVEGEFFPKWLRVLRRWVASEAPSLLELETWYRGWKGFFDKQQLAQHRRLLVHFHGALVLLNAASNKVGDNDDHRTATVGIPQLNRNAPSSYQDALVKARVDDPAGEDGDGSSNDDGLRAGGAFASRGYSSFSQQQRQSTKKTGVSHAVGMKDVIESLAIAHDVTFLPKGVHDGQQVYAFGAHHILIDQGVVFAEKQKGVFEPVDIEQLL